MKTLFTLMFIFFLLQHFIFASTRYGFSQSKDDAKE